MTPAIPLPAPVRPLVLAAAAALLAPAAFAQATLEACTTFPDGAETYACFCPPPATPGAVWGSGPYTGDSDLCTAARHAGVLSPNGGPVVALRVPAPQSYPAGSANGITTMEWGAYDSAFAFAGTPAAATFGTAATTTPPATVTQTDPVCGVYPETESIHFCTCPANFPLRPVRGSGPYTGDSDICTAALHDGYISQAGGPIVAIALTGLTFYTGKVSNGVTSADFETYGTSFIFDRNSN